MADHCRAHLPGSAVIRPSGMGGCGVGLDRERHYHELLAAIDSRKNLPQGGRAVKPLAVFRRGS